MGQLIKGRWTSTDQLTNQEGEFQRTVSVFQGNLPQSVVDASHYLLIVSRACPWAHRMLIAQKLQGFHEVEVHYAPPLLGEEGWLIPDSLSERFPLRWIHALYSESYQIYTGRATLPILWDKRLNRIVSNDSREMLLCFGHSWRRAQAADHESSPTQLMVVESAEELEALQREIQWITQRVTNGPYRAIFAEHQSQYEAHVIAFFETLDHIEARLKDRPFLMGERLSLCDLCLFPTLYRLDIAYRPYLKCALKRLSDYPAISAYMSRLAAIPAFAETLSPEEIDIHYRESVPKRDHQILLP